MHLWCLFPMCHERAGGLSPPLPQDSGPSPLAWAQSGEGVAVVYLGALLLPWKQAFGLEEHPLFLPGDHDACVSWAPSKEECKKEQNVTPQVRFPVK